MSTTSFFIHPYQRSSGYLSLPSSTLNFVFTVSATPQQNSDLGSARRWGFLSLSGRWRVSNHPLLGLSGHSPPARSSVGSSTSTIAAIPAAILRTDMGRPSDLVIDQFFLLIAR